MAKYSLLLIAILINTSTVFSQNEKEELFATAVKQVVEGFSKEDSTALSRLTDSTIGVYLLDYGNTYLKYEHVKTVRFSEVGKWHMLFSQAENIQLSVLQYAPLPQWIFSSESWSKTGLFVDTTQTDHMLSAGCKFKNKSEPDSYPQKTVDFFWQLESVSRRIVLQDKVGKEIAFYLSYLHNKWHLTIVDKATSNRSV
jgi:hypothetical protein